MTNTNNRTFEWIPVALLHSGLAYQRPIDEKFVREKVENFDKNEVDAPCVSLRNGQYNVIDGQHTIAIIKHIGWTKIRCEVRKGLTEADENEWFYIKNTKNRKQTSNRLLNAKFHGKFDKNMIQLTTILDSVGYKLNTYDVNNQHGVIKAGACIENIFNNTNYEDFKDCLMLHSLTWQGEKYSLESSFLNGMFKFYNTYSNDKNFEVKRFVKALSKIEPKDMKVEVKRDTSSDKIFIKYAKTMCKHYNKGISNKLKVSKLDD